MPAAVGRRTSRHPIVERMHSIGIAELRRVDAFDIDHPTEWNWPSFTFPGLLKLVIDRWGCVIAFTYQGRRVEQRIAICTVRRFHHIGELLFRCDCGRRAKALLDNGRGRYACKRCCGAHYACQAVSANRRKIARALKLRRRIEAAPAIGAPIERRRGGRRSTFERVKRTILRVEARIRPPRRRADRAW
jgi:hypothetical protein